MSLLNEIKRFLSQKALSDYKNSLSPPQTYFLELTNHCNLKCNMCNFHSPLVVQKRKKGFMQAALALHLLNDISTISEPKPWVALHGAGEPLLHKDLITILKKSSNLNLEIGFLTNGVLLSDEISKKLMDVPLTWIGFSIDGINREKFNKYRCGAEYEYVLSNVLNFIELAVARRPDIKMNVNMTMQDEMKSDVPEFLNFWLSKVSEVSISPCKPVGTRDNKLVKEFPAIPRIPCYMLFMMMVIYWDGSVGLCCEDWFNDGNMGNLNSEIIERVWNGKQFTRYRELHKNGRFSELTLCKDCDSWYNVVPQTYFDSDLHCYVKKNAWQYLYTKSDAP